MIATSDTKSSALAITSSAELRMAGAEDFLLRRLRNRLVNRLVKPGWSTACFTAKIGWSIERRWHEPVVWSMERRRQEPVAKVPNGLPGLHAGRVFFSPTHKRHGRSMCLSLVFMPCLYALSLCRVCMPGLYACVVLTLPQKYGYVVDVGVDFLLQTRGPRLHAPHLGDPWRSNRVDVPGSIFCLRQGDLRVCSGQFNDPPLS